MIAFDHDLESFDNTANWASGTPETKEAVLHFLKKLTPRGGTELEQAIYSAMSCLPQRPKKDKVALLLCFLCVFYSLPS